VLPAPNRLRKRAEFTSAVRASGGSRAGSRILVVHAHQTGARAGCPPRVGFVVSRTVGGAVVRNRTKRRLRALVAARLDRIPEGTDLVVRANPAAAGISSRELAAALDPLFHKVIGRLGGVT
jgi:ribonuclease P protein component